VVYIHDIDTSRPVIHPWSQGVAPGT
jgi:hypothetical protein